MALVPMEFEDSVTKITTATTPKITLASGVSEIGTTGTNVYAVKDGKTVYIKFRVNKVLSLNVWNDIGTIPSGFFNTDANVDFVAGDFTSDTWMQARITDGGAVRVYAKSPSSGTANTTIAITFTLVLTA